MFVKTEYEIYNLNLFKSIYVSEVPREGSDEKVYAITADDANGNTEIFGVYLTQENALNALDILGRDLADKKIVIIVESEEI